MIRLVGWTPRQVAADWILTERGGTLKKKMGKQADSNGFSVSIIYKDADLVLLDKPSGLLAVPGRGPACKIA